MTNTFTFDGFDPPTQNWSRLPHALIDNLDKIDSLAELKIIMYILRHTWGFKDHNKRMTLDELQYGRKRQDGSRFDRGTGMSRNSIRDGLRRAAGHGFIVVETNDEDKARIKRWFSLRGSNVDPQDSSTGSEVDPLEGLRGSEVDPRSEKETMILEKETYKKEPSQSGPTTISDDGQFFPPLPGDDDFSVHSDGIPHCSLHPGQVILWRKNAGEQSWASIVEVGNRSLVLTLMPSGQVLKGQNYARLQHCFVQNGTGWIPVEVAEPEYEDDGSKLGEIGVALRDKLSEVCNLDATAWRHMSPKQKAYIHEFITKTLMTEGYTPQDVAELGTYYQDHYWTAKNGDPLSPALLFKGAGSALSVWSSYVAWRGAGRPAPRAASGTKGKIEANKRTNRNEAERSKKLVRQVAYWRAVAATGYDVKIHPDWDEGWALGVPCLDSPIEESLLPAPLPDEFKGVTGFE